MKVYRGVELQIHVFFISILVGVEWLVSWPGRLTPAERAAGTHWIGGWVGPRTGIEGMEKRKFLLLPGLEFRLLGCPTRSQSLYRLRYPGCSIRYSTSSACPLLHSYSCLFFPSICPFLLPFSLFHFLFFSFISLNYD
jgi:hypothetical protein